MENRNMQVGRIFQVLSILQSSRLGMSVTEIESALTERGYEVQKRTVYRDIDALETAGFPIARDDGNPQRISIDNNVKIDNYLVLSPREILALYLARGALQPLASTPFHDDLQGLFKKIDDKLGESARDHLTEISEGFRFEPGPRWGLGMDPDVIDTLRAACVERQVITGVYASVSSQSTRDRRIGPHYLYFAKGALYLVGEDLDDKKVKVFSAPRFKSVVMTPDEYSGVVSTPEEFFSGAFGVFKDESKPVAVTLNFSKKIASYVRERKWHSSQQIISRDDGTVTMLLHCQVNHELVNWILGFGANVEIAEPRELIDAVLAESRRFIALNDKKAG